MSSYPAPNKSLTVFNTSNYNYSTSSSLTQYKGDLRYLKLTGGTESGSVTFTKGLTANADVTMYNSTGHPSIYLNGTSTQYGYIGFQNNSQSNQAGIYASATANGLVLDMRNLTSGLLFNKSGSTLASVDPSGNVIASSGYIKQGTNHAIVHASPNVKMCYGTNGGGSGTGTITFPITFTSTPTVTATVYSGSTNQTFFIGVSSVTTTSFFYSKTFVYSSASAGGQAGEGFCWIAIGV